jgi:hypothetical protein
MDKLKLYRCEFEGIWPVGNCLVLIAHDQGEAETLARMTIKHTTEIVVNEVAMNETKVVEYLSGDY